MSDMKQVKKNKERVKSDILIQWQNHFQAFIFYWKNFGKHRQKYNYEPKI